MSPTTSAVYWMTVSSDPASNSQTNPQTDPQADSQADPQPGMRHELSDAPA
ncbi:MULTISPECIES: hypothetical protein [unclassified Corynebacterium]|uniref:hypothetical protein n=1 Tax=Corynebacterium TaxID=1716 RepID=UPI00254F2D72|nr:MULTISPECIES: hypothetical protein [unclassified Corynebacterium]MDK8475069.1 hypothetical protein [Corynebacterium sp. MSK310]MDK8491072.1 hypothetical protein [Corynebacterium sp. MSK175]MDK8646758.1 hypothetical protein [Corynebacterium sp. MSK082]MDK8697429.1 hypothetical protein [Corynebacterium sp. MSK192]